MVWCGVLGLRQMGLVVPQLCPVTLDESQPFLRLMPHPLWDEVIPTSPGCEKH